MAHCDPVQVSDVQTNGADNEKAVDCPPLFSDPPSWLIDRLLVRTKFKLHTCANNVEVGVVVIGVQF
ncbi:hypothetical protein GCM10008090_15260 [Arenicella chitinivorans]|uniref:Uncharacterized protein n=1 Tax=Arenicella chitinivorans TaxID=1329800 RepID=A0A918VLN0_9GAMM|nr:hypothetical protein GCM10008090_15260 [Arenicella chitinivorans]